MLIWSEEHLWCRVGFWGGPRLDDRLTAWRRAHYGQDRRVNRRRRVGLYPCIIVRAEGHCLRQDCERAYYIRGAANLDEAIETLVAYHPPEGL